MSKLYVVNHLKDNISSDVTAILNTTQKLEANTDYKVSPVEVGFEYVKSLFEQFDEVAFDTSHDNYTVLIQQSELEIKYRQSTLTTNKEVLDNNRLTFFGCSHTYGIGHDDKSTTYPDILSTLIDIDYVNLGMPGKGNYAIEDLLTTYYIKNAKLVIQFTDIYRVKFLHNGKLIENKVYDLGYKNTVMFSEENLFLNFKKIVDRVVARLREGNNQFLITYTNNIDNEWAINANLFLHGYTEYCSAVGIQIDTASDGTHYGIQSHKLWADRLFFKWKSLYGN